jgi:hypothetical protein
MKYTEISLLQPISTSPNTSFQRTLTRSGLLTAKGRRDPPPPASVRWAGHHPPYHSSPRPQVAAGGGFRPLNSGR